MVSRIWPGSESKRSLVGGILAVAVITACGQVTASPDQSQPSPAPTIAPLQGVLASQELVVGRDQRVSFGVVDRNGAPVPDVSVIAQIFTLPSSGSGATPKALAPPQPAPYKGALLQGKGVYVIHQTFDHAGFYNAVVQAKKGSDSATTTVAMQVQESDPTPAVGTPAPASNNPTKDQVSDISVIDTGVPPDDMHYVSVAGAIAAHHPFVVYFGSPGFCVSKTCGPEVEVVKSLEASYRVKGIDFSHIETYKGGRPDASKTTSQWFDEWKLQTDPWVFVVDKQGSIAAKFDGPTTADEIEPALVPLAAGR